MYQWLMEQKRKQEEGDAAAGANAVANLRAQKAAPPPPPPPAVSDVAQMRQKFLSGQRDNIQRNAIGNQQQADDAITRRMTAIGQAGSGAAMGLQMKAREGIQANTNSALNDVLGQEMQGATQDADFGLRRAGFDASRIDANRANALAEAQFQQDVSNSAFNRRMAELQANQSRSSDPLMGLVTGIGAPLLGSYLGGLPAKPAAPKPGSYNQPGAVPF